MQVLYDHQFYSFLPADEYAKFYFFKKVRFFSGFLGFTLMKYQIAEDIIFITLSSLLSNTVAVV